MRKHDAVQIVDERIKVAVVEDLCLCSDCLERRLSALCPEHILYSSDHGYGLLASTKGGGKRRGAHCHVRHDSYEAEWAKPPAQVPAHSPLSRPQWRQAAYSFSLLPRRIVRPSDQKDQRWRECGKCQEQAVCGRRAEFLVGLLLVGTHRSNLGFGRTRFASDL